MHAVDVMAFMSKLFRIALTLQLSTLACCSGRSVDQIDGAAHIDAADLPHSDVSRTEIPETCRQNEDCGAGSYCHFASGCGADGPGSCRKRPPHCPGTGDYVCACDGKSYVNGCMAHQSGASVLSGGECDDAYLCYDLDKQYQATLEKAKDCCASCEQPTCTRKMPISLLCFDCTTLVSPDNSAAVHKLVTLKKLFLEICGDPRGMVGCLCGPPAKAAWCVEKGGEGSEGTCQDIEW